MSRSNIPGPATFETPSLSALDSRHEVLLLLNLGRPGPGAERARLPRLDAGEVIRTHEGVG
ncbi:hypothetical protein [Micromonospora chokoriensis]|uniref:hypothetical protein n=1 Tax=Micromonospora chokoriensis TaxID=356851 RepID=UPI0012FE0F27|nr:hypothetical protein [Micromonospora chokoriensis]